MVRKEKYVASQGNRRITNKWTLVRRNEKREWMGKDKRE